jgi:hypothetical protein
VKLKVGDQVRPKPTIYKNPWGPKGVQASHVYVIDSTRPTFCTHWKKGQCVCEWRGFRSISPKERCSSGGHRVRLKDTGMRASGEWTCSSQYFWEKVETAEPSDDKIEDLLI